LLKMSEKTTAMISKSQIKLITSLAHKKYRREHRMFVAEGAKIALEALQSQMTVHNVFALPAWLSANSASLVNISQEKIIPIDEREMGHVSQLSTPSPVLALLALPEYEPEMPVKGINLCLESIRDPGNLGTIIRLADWYGLDRIYCSEDCVDAYNSKVVQGSMGSIMRVKVHYLPSLEILADESGLPGYAAVLDGDLNLHTMQEIKKDCLLFIGNESQGLSETLAAKAAHTVSIPRFGEAESLNAATATAVMLDNFVRLSS
jgi:TrmH family RNA methyltransferase